MAVNDYANAVASLAARYTKDIDDVFDSLLKETVKLTDSEMSSFDKYKLVMGIEYLILRCRILASAEQVKVKGILQKLELSTALRSMFVKRDTYLINIFLRLNEISNDISIIQKIQYTKNINLN